MWVQERGKEVGGGGGRAGDIPRDTGQSEFERGVQFQGQQGIVQFSLRETGRS